VSYTPYYSETYYVEGRWGIEIGPASAINVSPKNKEREKEKAQEAKKKSRR